MKNGGICQFCGGDIGGARILRDGEPQAVNWVNDDRLALVEWLRDRAREMHKYGTVQGGRGESASAIDYWTKRDALQEVADELEATIRRAGEGP